MVLAPAIPWWPYPGASWYGIGSLSRHLFRGQRPLGPADEEVEGGPPASAPATPYWFAGVTGWDC